MLATKPRWDLPSWQRYFEMTPSRWELYRRVVREALADGPLNRQEVAAAVARRRELRHLAPHFASSWQCPMRMGVAPNPVRCRCTNPTRERGRPSLTRRVGAEVPPQDSRNFADVLQQCHPVSVGHAICIDTWVYGKGWLTALDVGSGKIWQANQKGETRAAWIDEFRVDETE